MRFTAQDVVHHMLCSTAGGAQDGEHAAVRQAVVHGTREVFQSRQWLWHTKTGSFLTQQLSTTATITSGSNQIVVADATGFVPGRMAGISSGFFGTRPFITSVSGTTITLDQVATSSGSGVTAQPQTFYDLPPGVKEIDTLMTQTVGTLHCFVSPNEWLRLQVNTIGAGEPYYYTVMRSDTHPDRYQIRFVGVPTNGTMCYYTYRYIPEPIKYMGYEHVCRIGTVTANGANVTGSGTEFPEDLAGRVIRFGTTTHNADPVGSLSPYQHEREIESRTSDLALVIDSPLTTPSNVKYAITDVLDASPQMYTAILSAADMWYARLTNKNVNESMVIAQRDLRLALEMDAISPQSNRMRHAYPTARSTGWYSPIRPDAG